MDFFPVFVSYGAGPPAVGAAFASILWFDTGNATLKRFNGTAWVDIAGAVGGGGGGPHTHPESDIVNLVADLIALSDAIAGKAPLVHGHAQADVTGLVAALAATEPAWTYAQVNGGADFTTTSAAAVDASGLAFAPAANTTYEFEGRLMIRTATATVNPRVGLAWPTGLTDGVARIEEAQSVTAQLFAHGNINAPLLVAVGGLPNTTQSWPVLVRGMLRAGATPAGQLRVQLASETAGTTVRIVARSHLKFRALAF